MIAQQLATLDPVTRQQIADREKKLSQALRDHKKANLPPVVIPPGKYRVIYADPPWSYHNSGAIDEGDNYGRAAKHYPCMSIEELCALPVRDVVADDAVLFLWVTSPLLFECQPVVTAWGFDYKTSMVWDKDAPNYGFYVAVSHELLLICTRGSCRPDHPAPMPDSVQTIHKSRVHSEKPEQFRQIIDQLYDGGPEHKLELFARAPAPGWSSHGNELEHLSTAV